MVAPDALQEKLRLLDSLIVAAGRQPGDVARTLMIPVQWFARDDLDGLRKIADEVMPKVAG